VLEFLNPIKGFGVTFQEMFRKVETVEYPEVKKPTAPRFHGHHQLNRWPEHPMRLGDNEKDYYRLGAAGLTAGPRAPGMSGPGGPSGPAVFAGSPDASLSWAPPDVREADRTQGGEDT
jgi:hypothetical protein